MTTPIRLANEEDIEYVRAMAVPRESRLTRYERVAETARIGLEAIALLRDISTANLSGYAQSQVDAFLARLDGAGAEEGK